MNLGKRCREVSWKHSCTFIMSSQWPEAFVRKECMNSTATELSDLLFLGLLPRCFPLKLINGISLICRTLCSWINKVKKKIVKCHHTVFFHSSCYRAVVSLGGFCKVLYVDLLTLSTLSVKSLACSGAEETREHKGGQQKAEWTQFLEWVEVTINSLLISLR